MSKKKDNGNEIKKEKGGSSKLVSIIVTAVVVFLLMSGAVFLGYTFASKGNASASASSNSGGTVDSSKAVENEATLELTEFLVNLSDEGNPRYLKVSMCLGSDSTNEDLQTQLKAKVPQIRDAINSTLRTKKSTDITPEGETIIKEEIIVKINNLLSKGKILNVYVTSIMVQ